eukprot:TRINITY_DN32563_c0_g1_i1.p1 TRINITY_DN32563_c0_g1~~TRINITY_DN32563_c0_g1_i1.p1  ORF type:complete len:190 (-),score=42.53 TRINITY_DN32563_c0_g1_i1:2-571(-)
MAVFPASDESVAKAVSLLKNGQVIAVPTDTIYGIACLVSSDTGIENIYRIKGRDADKPLPICVPAVKDVSRYGVVRKEDAITAVLPGPVSVVLPRSEFLNPKLNPTAHSVAIRVPDFNFVQKVVEALGEAIALTSANLSGEPSSVKIEEFAGIHDQLGGIFDGGVLESRLGSTIVSLAQHDPQRFRILR